MGETPVQKIVNPRDIFNQAEEMEDMTDLF